MSTANQIVREALEAAMQHVISYGGPSVEVTQKIDAALAALSEPSGDGERLRETAESFSHDSIPAQYRMNEDCVQHLYNMAEQIDCSQWQTARLRERVKELEGALREYADEKNWMCSNHSDGHEHNDGKCCLDEWNHATIWYPQDIARTALALQPAAPQ